ncbi:MAG: hypothetical protein WCG84_00745 [Candidatus Moraniibacteriota bacterium]
MEQEILKKLEEQEIKINEMARLVKSMRNYQRISFWFAVIFFILPLIGLGFAIPWLISTLQGAYTLPIM